VVLELAYSAAKEVSLLGVLASILDLWPNLTEAASKDGETVSAMMTRTMNCMAVEKLAPAAVISKFVLGPATGFSKLFVRNL